VCHFAQGQVHRQRGIDSERGEKFAAMTDDPLLLQQREARAACGAIRVKDLHRLPSLATTINQTFQQQVTPSIPYFPLRCSDKNTLVN
jgi:hypothetical protein